MRRIARATRLVFLCAAFLGAEDTTILHLKTRERDPSAEPASLRLSPLRRTTDGRSHLLVQFSQPPQPEQLQELERRGVKVLRAAPGSAVMVSASDDASFDGLALRWVGRMEPQDKISPLVTGDGDFLIEFHPDVDMDDARALAAENDLAVLEHPNLLAQHLLVRGAVDQLWRLSQWDEVAYIFPASPDLLDGTPLMACDGGATTSGLVGQYIASVGDGWDGPGLGSADLLYFFQSVTDKLPPATAQSEILRAYNIWTRYVKVSFQPGTSGTANRTINILFASGDHGDGYPFDGPGNTLAHTYYPAPPNPESIAGDMHFDADENWRQGLDVDLFSVALHEAGHALGLAHSDQPGAVMYPYYRKVTDLSQLDIDSIRQLYAAQDTTTTTPGTPLAISIQSPAGSPVTTTATSLAVSGTVAGGTGQSQVAWMSDRGSSGSATGSTSWAAAVPLSTGNNVITVTATDAAQARASVSVFIIRNGQTTTPTPVSLAITSPAASGIYTSSASSITLNGTASHPSGISRVTWANSLGGGGTAAGTTSWTTGPFPLSVGSNLITVTAYEPGGTSASRSIAVAYATAVKDTVPPTLRIIAPASNNVSTSAATITLRGSATDNLAVTEISWVTSTGSSGTAAGTTSWTAANIPLLVGTNTITVRAHDAAGNTAWRSVVVTRR